MWSAVNELPNSPKISALTKKDVFQLNVFSSNRKLREKRCREDYRNVLDPWTRWFPKVVLKQELSGIQVTIFFGVNNLRNI